MLTNKKKVWTAEDDRRLIEMHAARKSAGSMGVALKRTSAAVKTRLSSLRGRRQAVADPASGQGERSAPSGRSI